MAGSENGSGRRVTQGHGVAEPTFGSMVAGVRHTPTTSVFRPRHHGTRRHKAPPGPAALRAHDKFATMVDRIIAYGRAKRGYLAVGAVVLLVALGLSVPITRSAITS
jgi:hypothetical protein